MKVVFVHSHRFSRHEDSVYSDGKLPYHTWKRYLRHFDDVTVIARMMEAKSMPEGGDISSGPNVTFMGLPDDHGNYLQQLRKSRNMPIIRKALSDADAVIVRLSGIGWLAAKEAERLGVPWAVEVVGDAWDALWNYGNLVGKLHAPLAWYQARKWIHRAPFAIYVTNHTLQQRYPCRGMTSFASNVQIHPVPETVLQRRLRQQGGNAMRCGLIGSLSSRYKGLHFALRSMARLRNRGIELQLNVLGAGNRQAWRDEAKAIGVADLLHLDGTLPSGEEVFAWLDKLDFYIQPSLTEGLPRALIEAMSRGLPALASSCGGIPELLPRECLHSPGDHDIFTTHMQRMVEDEGWRLQLTERNFNEAKLFYAETIEERRDTFWASFANYAREQQTKSHPCASSS